MVFIKTYLNALFGGVLVNERSGWKLFSRPPVVAANIGSALYAEHRISDIGR